MYNTFTILINFDSANLWQYTWKVNMYKNGMLEFTFVSCFTTIYLSPVEQLVLLVATYVSSIQPLLIMFLYLVPPSPLLSNQHMQLPTEVSHSGYSNSVPCFWSVSTIPCGSMEHWSPSSFSQWCSCCLPLSLWSQFPTQTRMTPRELFVWTTLAFPTMSLSSMHSLKMKPAWHSTCL